LRVGLLEVGLGISDKKIIPRKTELTEQLVTSDGIPAVLRNRKFSEFRSEPFRGGENNSEFHPVDQKFPSEPFSGRENSSEFRSVELK
jgi:hypothetical protein